MSQSIVPNPALNGHTVKDEGTARTQRSGLDFIGGGVAATDNSGGDKSDITIAGQFVPYVPVVVEPAFNIAQSVVAGNYYGGPLGTGSGNFSNISASVLHPIFAADYAVSGFTTKMKVRIGVMTNTNAAPAVTFTGGLSLISASAGGSNTSTLTVDAQTSGTTAAVASPSVSTINNQTSAAFTIPTDGYYILTCTTSGTTAAGSRTAIVLSLFVAHV